MPLRRALIAIALAVAAFIGFTAVAAQAAGGLSATFAKAMMPATSSPASFPANGPLLNSRFWSTARSIINNANSLIHAAALAVHFDRGRD